jgi:hypothetical protein
MSLCLVAVPVLLDTNTEAPHLLTQWARMYHYGHRIMPAMAISTLVLYGYTCAKRVGAKKSWSIFGLAGATTVGIIPFTLIFMVPTNDELFRLHAMSKESPFGPGIQGVRELVLKWTWLHGVRSLFPLAGAVMGTLGTI